MRKNTLMSSLYEYFNLSNIFLYEYKNDDDYDKTNHLFYHIIVFVYYITCECISSWFVLICFVVQFFKNFFSKQYNMDITIFLFYHLSLLFNISVIKLFYDKLNFNLLLMVLHIFYCIRK